MQLVFYGSNLVQFATAFYPLPYWFSTVASASALLLSMALLYVYTGRLKLLLALPTAFVFFLSWRNISEYAVTVLPVVIAMYCCKNRLDKQDIDRVKSLKPAIFCVAALFLVLMLTAIYAHGAYANERRISLDALVPIISTYNTTNGPLFFLRGFVANVSNNEAVSRNITFFVASSNPTSYTYVLGRNLDSLAPGSSHAYVIDYSLPMISNGTKLFVTAITDDYMASRQIGINLGTR
jgi:hypothetical protein